MSNLKNGMLKLNLKIYEFNYYIFGWLIRVPRIICKKSKILKNSLLFVATTHY